MLVSLLFIVVVLVCTVAPFGSGADLDQQKDIFNRLFANAVGSINAGDYASAAAQLQESLQYDQQNVDATQLLGVLYHKLGDTSQAIVMLQQAIERDQYRDMGIVANYIEVLRSNGEPDKARDVGYAALRSVEATRPRDCIGTLMNLGTVELALKNDMAANELFLRAARLDPGLSRAWQLSGEIMVKHAPNQAEAVLLEATAANPTDFTLHFMLGTAYQFQHKLDIALKMYLYAETLDNESYSLKGNIASTYQGLGMAKDALRYYEMALPHSVGDAGLYNNYGALLGIMGRDDDQAVWLEKALEIKPTLLPALINLAGYYQDEGDLVRAREMTRRARESSALSTGLEMADYSGPLLRLRDALMLSPVTASWEQMYEERVNFTQGLQTILDSVLSSTEPLTKVDVDTSLDRIHFYVSYHGLNDRALQDLVMRLYHLHLRIQYRSPHVLPLAQAGFPDWIQPAASAPPSPTLAPLTAVLPSAAQLSLLSLPLPRRARIGFLSKFFGIFEPHGMLLDGVMCYLPRDRFEVLALPVARADTKPLSPSVAASCDSVHEVSLTYSHAQIIIQNLHLDVLVFADTVSEPMSHFLAHSRLAPIQMAFWGNPITTGSHEIDYFISADVMEHPHRTRMPIAHEPYTEQVVLMEGQGIWYLHPDIEGDLINSDLKDKVAPTRTYARADFGLQEGWFLYVLPQSTFKIHPLYDLVLRDILQRAPQAHLVVTGGRRPRWTQIYMTRLQTALGPELSQRLHMMSRVSSEQFPALLEIADVILHPFPFDGSKTSADALYVHKPIVTLPTEYLRGRMGAAFLRTMNLPELVARSRSEYVDIAVRLSSDRAFYDRAVGVIKETVDLIWEDMEVPFTWSNLLCGIIGVPAPSWDAFLAQTGRDVAEEKHRSATRDRNALAFDARWGPETWLLQNGVAALETTLDSAQQVPCIFRDWKCTNTNSQRMVGSPEEPSTLRSIQIDSNRTLDADGNLVITEEENERIAAIRAEYLSLANTGDFQAALPLAEALYAYYSHIPLYLVEVGLIHVFLGNHAQGVRYCTEAAAIDPDASLLQGCIGLAGMYIPDRASETIAAFRKALQLKQSEQQRVEAYLRDNQENLPADPTAQENAAGVMSSAVFSLPVYALENNLLSSFRIHKQHSQCVEWCVDVNALPSFRDGGAVVLAFAAVLWSPTSRKHIDAVESALRAAGEFNVPPSVRLWDEIHRVQGKSKHMLTVALECLQGLRGDPERPEYLNRLLGEMMQIMLRIEEEIPAEGISPLPSSVPAALTATEIRPGVVLVLQYYSPAEESKSSDINIALWRNLQNDYITDVYLLNEVELKFNGFPNAHKIHQIVIGERLTFQRAFAFANEHLQGRIVILANTDIFFDATLRRLSGEAGRVPRLGADKTVLALLKWVYEGATESISLGVRTDSQDAWVFQPPVSVAVLAELDFYMGLPRCDNRMVYVLEQHNYTVLGPAFAVHALELDSTRRTQILYDTKKTVLGFTSTLLLSDAFEF